MSVVSNALDTGSVALSVKQITGSTADAAVAAGYSAWVKSVTGSTPSVAEVNGVAKILLTDAQAVAMRKSLESNVFSKKKEGKLEIVFSPVINPLLVVPDPQCSHILFSWVHGQGQAITTKKC